MHLRQDAYKSAQVQGQIEAQPAVTIGATDVSTLEGKQQDSKILEVPVVEHAAKRKADDEPGPPGKRSKQGTPSAYCCDVPLRPILSLGSPSPSKR